MESHHSIRAIECMSREVAGLLRTLKAALEPRIFGKVKLNHDFIGCMTRHSAWLITSFRVRAWGLSAYELIQQRKYWGASVEFGEIVCAKLPSTKKLGKLYQRWIEVVWAGKTEGSDEHIRLNHPGAMRLRAVCRKPESSRWWREVILDVARCPWEVRPVGRTSPPDASCRVAVVGAHEAAANLAPAAETAAAAAELPAAEALRPDDDWADLANTPITASGRRLCIIDATAKKLGASMGCP